MRLTVSCSLAMAIWTLPTCVQQLWVLHKHSPGEGPQTPDPVAGPPGVLLNPNPKRLSWPKSQSVLRSPSSDFQIKLGLSPKPLYITMNRALSFHLACIRLSAPSSCREELNSQD